MKKLILLLFLFHLSINNSYASHVFGAEIAYSCAGHGVYQVTYIFYRDCFGIPAPTSLPLVVENNCGIAPTTVTLFPISSELIFPTCSLVTSTCQGGTAQGIQKWIYQGIVTLSDTCHSWTLGVSMSARSAGISMTPNPDSYNLWVEAVINNTSVDCDNSPVFMNDPFIQVCKGQPYCYNPELFDADGDSMVAAFIVPKNDHNTGIPYNTGFSLLYPMTLNSPLTIDPATGQFCFTPLANDYSQYAIQVTTYRNGEIIGTVERDIGIIVRNCPNEQPQLSGINGFAPVDTFVCANDLLCFDIYSNPFSPADSTFILWDNSIPGATFNINQAQNELATFCWTPSMNMVSTIPYCFTAYVNDNNCIPPQGNNKTYCITVYDSVGCLFAGINNTSHDEIEIYPQPANDFIRVKLDQDENVIVRITDVLGKTVYESNSTPVNNELIIPTRRLPSATYFLTLKKQKGQILFSKKIMIMKL